MAVKTVTATLNGQNIILSLNSSTGKYEATVTAPSVSSYNQTGHYYNVEVTATDDAGNVTTVDATDETLGSSLQLKVTEKVAPVVTISYPTAGAYLSDTNPEIEFSVTDDDSGVNVSTITLTVDGTAVDASAITTTASEGGYTCTCALDTALDDGEHTIEINASDNDGNAAVAKTVTFTVDTVPPVLNISSPTDNTVTNSTTITVSGTTDDVSSKPVTITVNGTETTVGDDGAWSLGVTLTDGENIITVVATDKTGRTTTLTRTVTLDLNAPVIKSVTLTPNPVDAGKTFIISVEVED